MQRLAIRILSLALITVSSAAAVETQYPTGGLLPLASTNSKACWNTSTLPRKSRSRPDPSCGRPSKPSPSPLASPITPEQQADLRDWLYDFLVAFSASGNDSLAAQFYLREGVNNPRALQNMQATLASWGIPQGDTPFALFQAMHRALLDDQGYDYRFGNAFFRHSTFKSIRDAGRVRKLSVASEGRRQGAVQIAEGD